MIRRTGLLILLLVLVKFINAQNSYFFKEIKIGVNSPISFSNPNYGGLSLETDGLKVQLGTLGGMEGINGLEGSLDSYAGSFGFQSVGKAYPLQLKNLQATRIDANNNGQNVILVMFATNDFKHHFICEIYYSANEKTEAGIIAQSIYYDENANNTSITNTSSNQAITSTSNSSVEKSADDEVKNKPVNSNITTGLTKGAKAPDFTLKDISGKSISLSDLKGKTVMLDFWGTWCGPCIESIPELKALYQKYRNNNFEIVSVANDRNEEKWRSVVNNKGMTWTNVIDQTEAVTKQYQIKAFPTLMLIDANGIFVSTQAYENDVEEYLNATKESSIINSNSTPSINSDNQTSITAPVTNTHLNGKPIEKITWQLLSTYSPDGYIILDDYLKAPSEYQGTTSSGDSDFTVWIEGTAEKDIVNSANTVVHEMCHGYTGKLYLKLLQDEGKPVENGSYSAFYIGNHKAILVKHTDVYETKEINSIFPEKLKTSRYATYVYPSEKIMGSQQSGCYGLLDELNAYYWGTRTSYDFYNYFKNKSNTQQGWSNFFSDFYGTSYAYLEFKSYILYYLLYAKDNHKDIYDGIMANKDFLEAFQKVDDNWSKLITDFRKLRQNFIAEQKRNGMAIKEEGGFLYFGSNGTGNFSEIYNLFKEELKGEKFQALTNALGLRSSSAPELFD